MIPDNKVDLGSIQIHKKVIGDIAALALNEVDGVSLIPKDLGGQILDVLGRKEAPGVMVSVDKNNQVTIELKVFVRYGMNIPEAARNVQDVVRAAVEKSTDIHLREVNVNVQGIIERGKS